MILIDRPQRWGTRTHWSHMISSEPGPAGTDELVAFGARIGLAPRWLQLRGTEREHFDVKGAVYQRALDAGARSVGRRELVTAIQAKRHCRTPVGGWTE